MKVSVQKLEELMACEEQIDVFIDVFGEDEEIEVTVALCVTNANSFDWDWAAEMLLPDELWEEYEKRIEPFYCVFLGELQKLAKERERVTSKTYVAHKKAVDALEVDFKARCAEIFGQLAEKVP